MKKKDQNEEEDEKEKKDGEWEEVVGWAVTCFGGRLSGALKAIGKKKQTITREPQIEGKKLSTANKVTNDSTVADSFSSLNFTNDIFSHSRELFGNEEP